MEPTSSPDNARPSPGLSRFWQVLPEPDLPEPAETPADLLPGSPLGTFRSHPIPPLAPISSSSRHPSGADPFGLNRAPAASRRNPAPVPPDTGRAAPEEDRDTDHSVPSDELPGPSQDVQSQEPEGGPFGGFGLGGRTGRFGPSEHRDQEGDSPADAEPAAGPADRNPPDSGRDAAETAEDSDENGRDDMNGRAGAPGYAQTGEAGPEPAGDAAAEPSVPAEPARPASGWASVPGQAQPVTPTSGGPVSGVPVSPAYANPYSVADFTPDHPAGNLQPVSAQPVQAVPLPAAHQPEPADPAGSAPVSPAAPAPATVQASVQIPATRPPADPIVERAPEVPDFPGLPPAAEGGYGFNPTGYNLGRTPEAYGVASVTPAPVSAVPKPASFPSPVEQTPSFPPPGEQFSSLGETSLTIDVPARRSASLEDAEPVRRANRRSAHVEDSAPAAAVETVADEPLIGRSVWDEDAARHFRAAWHEVKAEFVDDPVTALTRAHDLLTDAVNELTEVLLAERDELDPLRGTGTPDTESMRMAMRGYREYLERILSL